MRWPSIIPIMLLAGALHAEQQHYVIDPQHLTVGFLVGHVGFAPAGNGGGVPEARKEAAAEAPPAARAKRKRRAPAGNGAAAAEDATKTARTAAPAEPG